MKHALSLSLRRLLIAVLILPTLIKHEGLSQINLSLESAQIQAAYKTPAFLSFNVKYTSALETTPTVLDDSTMGSFKISGNNYWGNLDSTEFMQNGSYAVYLYKSNKIMNINNPRIVYPQVANFSLLDSLLGKNNYAAALSTSGINKVITITFYGEAHHIED